MQVIQMERDMGIMSVQDGFEKFMRMKRFQKLSPDTIGYYDQCFRYFSEYFDASQPCAIICKDTFYEYIEYLEKNRNANTVTINTYLRGIRALFYYFMEEGYTKQFKVELLKQKKTIKETYSEADLERLLKKPDMKKTLFSEYRSWVMTNYLIATGNRIRTAINIQNKHLDFENGLILLAETKNGRQMIIPMSNSLVPILQEYLLYRKGEPDDYLFCDIKGRQLTRDGVTTVLYRYNRKRGVEKTSVHLYRHYFTKHWIMNGGDPFELQSVLGHSSPDMVQNAINDCFYINSTEKAVASTARSTARNTSEWLTNVQGLTSSQLKQQSTYTGFDFNTIWAISSDKNNGYPYLR